MYMIEDRGIINLTSYPRFNILDPTYPLLEDNVMRVIGISKNLLSILSIIFVVGCSNISTTNLLTPMEKGSERVVGATGLLNDNQNVNNIVHFAKIPSNAKAEKSPVWDLSVIEYKATGSRLGGILNAKILENVEDYASEVKNLGIESVTGNILPLGDGTGFATNENRLQDLWVAGRYEDAPIIGKITIWVKTKKGEPR